MPIEFIPNQPIIFTDNSQSCLNNDNKAYAQMMQPDDMMCVQVKQEPCGYEQMCTIFDPETNWTTNPDFSGDASGWTLGTGWAYGTDNVIYTGTGSGNKLAQTLSQLMVVGTHYVVTVEVTELTGKIGVYVAASQVALLDTIGTYLFYHTARTREDKIWIVEDPYQLFDGTCTISTFDVEQILNCFEWVDNGDIQLGKEMNANSGFQGNANNWTLGSGWVYGSNKVTIATPGANGTISTVCNILIDQLGYGVEIDSNITAGSISVYYGNELLGVISAHVPTITFYEVPLGHFIGIYNINALVLVPSNTFVGSISQATIYDPNLYWTINNDGELCKSRIDLFPIVSNNTPANIGGTANITFEINNRTLGSITPQWGTTNGLAVNGNGTFSQYINAAANGELIFIEDSTFDGCIGLISAKEMNLGSSFTIISEDGTTDISDHYNNTTIDYPVIYDNEYITWCIKLSDLTLFDIPVNLPTACYRIMFTDDCASIEYISDTLIHYSSTNLPCTRMVIGSNTGEQFGFNWNDFIMYQRLKVLRITPEHKMKGEDYFDSRGEGFNAYIEADKQWVAWFDLLDENTHDALSIQLYSNNFSIDTVPYFCPIQDIQPLWATNMKRNLAQLKVELRKKVGKLFKKLS